MAADGSQGAALALEEAEESLSELLDIEDYYFGADKEEKKKSAAETAIACAETALTCAEKPSSNTHAKACCVKGRALSFLANQDRQAEELLSKALKLNPNLVEAWNALGEVYWNQGSFNQAKNSFEQALELCGPNAVSLRNLSMVLRALDCDDIEKAANVAAGLAKAKEATVLDASDPLNWETLGNAYMGEFFVNGKRVEELNKALIAFTRAEDTYEKLGKRNPTLHMNRARAAAFLEDYTLALKSFQTAQEIGGTKAGDEVEKIVELVGRLAGMVDRKGDLKAKRLKELTSSMPQGSSSLEQLRSAKQGEIQPLSAKVVSVIDRKEVPVMLICCDALGDFFALSLYNAEQAKIAEAVVPLQTTLEIKKPHFRQICVETPKATHSYACVRVAHPVDVVVVGGGNLSAAAVKPVFSSERAA